jgi:two-component system sensor histidine kinase/response regulator
MKKDTGGGHCPLIVLTAHATRQIEEKCLQAGMDDFLTKPFTKKKVLEVIRQQTNRRDGEIESW